MLIKLFMVVAAAFVLGAAYNFTWKGGNRYGLSFRYRRPVLGWACLAAAFACAAAAFLLSGPR